MKHLAAPQCDFTPPCKCSRPPPPRALPGFIRNTILMASILKLDAQGMNAARHRQEAHVKVLPFGGEKAASGSTCQCAKLYHVACAK